MSRRTFATLFLCAGGALLLLFTPSGQTLSQNIQSVLVTNFPDVQRIEGKVNVKGAIRLAEMVTFKEIIVPPVDPTETTRLVEAGTLITDGFTNVVLSLHGVVRGDVKRSGDIGVILIPDEKTVQDAFNEQGKIHFSLEERLLRDRGFDPFEPVQRRCDGVVVRLDLVRRLGTGDEGHSLEIQRGRDLAGRPQMAEMNRIERPPIDSDSALFVNRAVRGHSRS